MPRISTTLAGLGLKGVRTDWERRATGAGGLRWFFDEPGAQPVKFVLARSCSDTACESGEVRE